jgi:hypothetical protein
LLYNPLFLVIASVGITSFVLWKIFNRKATARMINRADILKTDMIDILKYNECERTILRENGFTKGIVVGWFKYKYNDKLLHFLLYNPSWVWFFTKTWDKQVLFVSEECIKEIIDKPTKLFGVKSKKTVKNFILKDNYAFDRWEGIRMSFADETIKTFLQHRLALQENEVKGSVKIAQAMRLTLFDMTKPYEPSIIPTQQPSPEVKK